MNAQPELPPRSASWQLGPEAGMLARAREHTLAFLSDLCEGAAAAGERPAALQDALVVVSELVSNAMRHAPGPCTLELTDRSGTVTIAVSDASTTPPQPRAGDLEDAGGGFGWHLLQRLSQQVRVQLDPPHGKTVSATMTLSSREPGPLGPLDPLGPPSPPGPLARGHGGRTAARPVPERGRPVAG
jgi:anti-sigma regulatory factor (Ser/Thr protein kinase)